MIYYYDYIEIDRYHTIVIMNYGVSVLGPSVCRLNSQVVVQAVLFTHHAV